MRTLAMQAGWIQWGSAHICRPHQCGLQARQITIKQISRILFLYICISRHNRNNNSMGTCPTDFRFSGRKARQNHSTRWNPNQNPRLYAHVYMHIIPALAQAQVISACSVWKQCFAVAFVASVPWKHLSFHPSAKVSFLSLSHHW